MMYQPHTQQVSYHTMRLVIRAAVDAASLTGQVREELNRLDRECLGLSRSGTFEYRVQSGARHARLCATDSITVIESTGRGLNCGLGMFEPLSPDERESLFGRPNPPITSAPVDLPKPEPPPAPPAEPAPPP